MSVKVGERAAGVSVTGEEVGVDVAAWQATNEVNKNIVHNHLVLMASSSALTGISSH
jgi:hypothetical protein